LEGKPKRDQQGIEGNGIAKGREDDFVPFIHQEMYTKMVACHEFIFVTVAAVAMLLSCALPIYLHGHEAMNRRGPLIAVGGTTLSMCALAFSRRYLHGEFMYGRFVLLSAGLTLGFNLVAVATTLESALTGWKIMGLCSTFLIGPYNERSTARDNATFVFFVYSISDAALVVAAKLSTVSDVADGGRNAEVIAFLLLWSALLHSGQFPVTNLFMRSMEGPAPTSALGYAGLSAHAGVVLLSSTMPLWFGFNWARILLAVVGATSSIIAGVVCKIRADRKGALASATSSTLGMIYVVLAAGYANTALVLSLGHAAFRMLQFLRSANFILDSHNLHCAIGDELRPRKVPECLYKLGWMLNRFNNAFHMPHVLRLVPKVSPFKAETLQQFHWSTFKQWMVAIPVVVLAGMPFTPVENLKDRVVTVDFLLDHPIQAACYLALNAVVSTVLIRFIFANVLDPKRFRHSAAREFGCCSYLCRI